MSGYFSPLFLDVRTEDGADDELLSSTIFYSSTGQIYQCPPGSTTDGLSDPTIFQNLLPRSGIYWLSAVLHDCAYRNTLLIFRDGWVKAELSKEDCDTLFLETLEAQGVGLQRWTIYWGVRLFGREAFENDRKKTCSDPAAGA
jgi:hypothetical protein